MSTLDGALLSIAIMWGAVYWGFVFFRRFLGGPSPEETALNINWRPPMGPKEHNPNTAFVSRYNRGDCRCADCNKKRRSYGWQEQDAVLGREICGDYEIWDPMSGMEMFCILPVGHSGSHDYRVDTGPWSESYIQFYEGGAWWGHQELKDSDLREIGEFTRENVARWLAEQERVYPATRRVSDFRAVCGDIRIPLAHNGNAQPFVDKDNMGTCNCIECCEKRSKNSIEAQ